MIRFWTFVCAMFAMFHACTNGDKLDQLDSRVRDNCKQEIGHK